MFGNTRRSALFRIKPGQVVLLLIAAIGIGSLAGWSVYSSTPHQVEKLAILSESNDAASLAYSQRESFNLALILEDWVRGEVPIRDVEISRALLGQRLQVRLVNGSPTFDVMTGLYKLNLAKIDQFIISNSSTPLSMRRKIFDGLKPSYKIFLTETRRMSKTIQQESLRQVNKVVQKRTRSEFYQSGILLFIILVGLTLLVWFVKDLSKAFREAQLILQDEQRKLNSTTKLLEISKEMDSFQGKLAEIQLTSSESKNFSKKIEGLLRSEKNFKLLNVVPDGETFQILLPSNFPLDESARDLIHIRFSDAIKQHQSRLRIFVEAEYRATHDPLTGFLNEQGLTALLDSNTLNNQINYAAIFIDVDRFHRINDSMGFEYGDSVMQEIGTRMEKLSSDGEFIARLNSDEFVVIVPVNDDVDAKEKALSLQSALQFTTQHNKIELNLTFTIGLVIFPTFAMTSTNLFHEGALALNIANRQIRAGFATYSKGQGMEFVDSLAEEFAIRQAIKLNEFELYFQPVIELSTNTVQGGEALIRWNRPGYGVILPDEFLAKVHDHDLEVELGDWVIENALRFRVNARLFQAELNLESFRVGINVEAAQLRRPDFADKILDALQKLNIDGADVSIEITEHALTDGEVALHQLQKLRSNNFVIAIDDFGTGYSNLAQVNSLPVSVLKIDKSFLIPRIGQTIDRQLVLDIKQLADNLNLRVVAEGVESAEVEKFLVNSGITRVQGFYYSPPLSEINFWSWVREFNNTRAFSPPE